MKGIILIICLCYLYVGRVCAQYTYSIHPDAKSIKHALGFFYIKPYLEYKASFSSSYRDYQHVNNNPYYKIKSERLFVPIPFNRLRSDDMGRYGLSVGYAFSNDKFAIESGVGYDGITLSYGRIYFLRYDTLQHTTYTSYFGGRNGAAGLKIPLLFSMQLLKWDTLRLYNSRRSFKIKLNLKFGVNFFRGFNNTPLGSKDSGILVAPNTYISVYETTQRNFNNSRLWQIGFDCDLVFKKLKGFTLSFYYLKGSNYMLTTKIDVNVTGYDTYTYLVHSSGSGFYLQLSKKINF